MYRAVVHALIAGRREPSEAVTIYSQAFKDEGMAVEVFNDLLAMPGVCGGHMEESIDISASSGPATMWCLWDGYEEEDNSCGDDDE